MTPIQPEYDLQLKEALLSKSLVLFIGPDLPRNITGLPSRDDLAAALATRRGYSNQMTLAEVTQRYYSFGNRWEFSNFIRDSLETTSNFPRPFHKKIAEVVKEHNIELIIDTTFDKLLKTAVEMACASINYVIHGTDVSFIKSNRPTIIKLYGEIQQPETLIVTDQDHLILLRDRDKEPILDEVRRAFRRNTILFLGYNLADPDFRIIFDQIAENHFTRTPFAVWSGLSEVDVQMWRDRGIVILETDPFGILGAMDQTKFNSIKSEVPVLYPAASHPAIGNLEIPRTVKYYGNGNRWGLIVGVNQYDDMNHYRNLHVCDKDALALYNQLLSSGYQKERVRILTDNTPDELPTRDNVLVALKSIAQATEPDDLLLFFYSGHGDEENGESYLISRSGKRLVLDDSAIRISRIKQIMEQSPARAKIIILDACHSGANIEGKGSKQMSDEFIRSVFSQAEGLAILASCKQGQVSYEWKTNERSVFTYFLLEALSGCADVDEKGFVTIQDANRYVVNGVKLWASQHNFSQTPTLQVEIAGDIIITDNTTNK
jgi:hypothetical protein